MAVEERFRRPAEHEKLLTDLTGKDGPFRAMVDAMMFAAALGKSKGRRVPFDKTGEPIRLALLENRTYGDVLVNLIAAAEVSEDAKILGDDRLKERMLIFEEYANGGLQYLQGELNASGRRDFVSIVSNLMMDALTTSPASEEVSVSGMLEEAQLDW
ncbi:DNA phosphorothioation-associated protein 4 [Streptomyces herbicida]|uniref:DNA phosphorothioation-associated protein 4 n=1 Tax=Streptomyces herbicida TaxID=3065675 RepID=UPI002931DBE0|nr:DNA phosphorothioation-associated protein 4 [Streptomyces sp. NEAU-HV9]